MDRETWSALPPELVLSIAERLETRTDIMQIRTVCQTWRSSVPLSMLSSRNFLSPLFPYRGMSHSSVLVANSVFLLQSTVDCKHQSLLISVEELNPGKLYVRAPLSRVVTRVLPIGSPNSFGWSDFQELGRFYTLRRVDRPEDMFSEKRLTEYDNKVVLFVDPNCETCPTIDDCTVIELYDQVDYLSVTRLKDGETQQVYFKGREFDDLVSFSGRVYAVDYEGRVCSMDYQSLKMSSVSEGPVPGGSRSNYKKRFAVSSGELYLILRRSQIGDHEAAFKVFKLNQEKQKWDSIEGIGDDRILFVTFDGCFFALAKDFPGWKGNCIVFRRGSFPEYSGIRDFDSKIFQTWKLHLDVAVFNFGDGDCRPLETYPGYSSVFWSHLPWCQADNCLCNRGLRIPSTYIKQL
ncbi:F-box protein SKIP23-like isoform X3 [Chenopodium quinoa]|uniref:F-box protein SKIP23-like isoform X3 n=1 Tax=Chenopodium quinoa TaxID=63459 RepID=UPI000B78F01A|nr:F-box protein SKIP23-like isoform X3 [Chenopodium quinoa]